MPAAECAQVSKTTFTLHKDIFSCVSFTLPSCLRCCLSRGIKGCPTFSPRCFGVEALTETTFLLGLTLLPLINICVINLLWHKASPYPPNHPLTQPARQFDSSPKAAFGLQVANTGCSIQSSHPHVVLLSLFCLSAAFFSVIGTFEVFFPLGAWW